MKTDLKTMKPATPMNGRSGKPRIPKEIREELKRTPVTTDAMRDELAKANRKRKPRKKPAAPMNGRWLRKGEKIQETDRYLSLEDGIKRPMRAIIGRSIWLCDMPEICQGTPFGWFRPGKARSRKSGKPRKKPRATRSWWVFECSLKDHGPWLIEKQSQEEADERIEIITAQGYKCGKPVRVEVPRA